MSFLCRDSLPLNWLHKRGAFSEQWVPSLYNETWHFGDLLYYPLVILLKIPCIFIGGDVPKAHDIFVDLLLRRHLARSTHCEMASQDQSTTKDRRAAMSLWSRLTF